MSTGDPPGAHGAELISVDGLTRAFGARTAIRGLSLVVREGEVFGFVGANGGGKTTALRLIAGLLKADGGRGRVLGLDLLRARDEIRRHIGYMSQHFSLYPDLAVIENLTFRAEIYGLPRPRDAADRAMAEFGLTAFSRQRAGRLSGGWARRLQFAAALIHCPRLILLDEPTAGLDIAHRQETWRRIFALAADGAGIVVSTHDLAEAEACTGVAFFADGLVQASGPPDALIAALAGSRDGAVHCTGGGLAEVASRLSPGPGVAGGA